MRMQTNYLQVYSMGIWWDKKTFVGSGFRWQAVFMRKECRSNDSNPSVLTSNTNNNREKGVSGLEVV